MKRICALLIIATVLLASCGKAGAEFVGTWTGKAEITADQEKQMKELMGEAGFQEFTESSKSNPLVIELNSDNTSKTISASQNIAGTWELSEDGKTITVIADKKPNTFVADIVLDVSDDGNTLTWTMPFEIAYVVVFTK